MRIPSAAGLYLQEEKIVVGNILHQDIFLLINTIKIRFYIYNILMIMGTEKRGYILMIGITARLSPSFVVHTRKQKNYQMVPREMLNSSNCWTLLMVTQLLHIGFLLVKTQTNQL